MSRSVIEASQAVGPARRVESKGRLLVESSQKVAVQDESATILHDSMSAAEGAGVEVLCLL
ncbi:hypothetical protein, partial [Nocardia sp. NPDC057030]|uniref:hypothetical protein n=1 Tax=Nocardia sp. NPDC057030 TaxID=3346005 RepID=UPI00362672D0